jgi:ribosome-associated translation inhibitor RaiA
MAFLVRPMRRTGARMSSIGQTPTAGRSTVEIRMLQPEEQMQIQTNTDRNITGSEGLAAQAHAIAEGALARFSDQITRVEIHLSHENGAGGGAEDKRCMMEARLEGRQPIAVTHQAATVEQAMEGAADKLKRSIESTLGRLRDMQ